jgi:hypothetical protein
VRSSSTISEPECLGFETRKVFYSCRCLVGAYEPATGCIGQGNVLAHPPLSTTWWKGANEGEYELSLIVLERG